jgi:very-short-patch-repair endonuclease
MNRSKALPRTESRRRRGSEVEELFALMMRGRGLPQPEREYRFDPVRRWRFDFCWPAAKLAVEVDGGIWFGRHTRGRGFAADHEKMNAAVLAGWRVLRFTPEMVQDGTALEALKALLTVKKNVRIPKKELSDGL